MEGVARRWLWLVVAGGIAAGGIIAMRLPALQALDRIVYDWMLRAQGGMRASGDVVVVAVDDQAIARFGRWPWPRSRVAALIDRLPALGARVVAVDLHFPDPSAPSEDARLARALSEAGAVGGFVLHAVGTHDPLALRGEEALAAIECGLVSRARIAPAAEALRAEALTPQILPIMRALGGCGFLNFVPDADGVIRFHPLAAVVEGFAVAPMAAVAAARWLGAPIEVELGRWGGALRAGGRQVALSPQGLVWLRPVEGLPVVSAAEVLEGRVAKEALAGKLAFVGFTATGLVDIRPTPLDPLTPGVEVHATIAENLSRGLFIARPPAAVAAEGAAAIVVALVLAWWWRERWVERDHGLFLLVMLALWAAAAYAALALGVWVRPSGVAAEIVVGGVALLAWHQARAVRERRTIRRTFERYIDPKIVREALRHPEQMGLGGEEREISVLFMDIAGFTRFSEMIPPREVVRCLNAFFDAATEVVFAERGAVDRLTGDGLIALFGAPLPDEAHATHACRAALRLDAALERIRPRFEAAGAELFVRVGINSGRMVVGNIGSKRRFHYTFIGDAGNVAARLESLNKQYGSRRMIGEATARLVGDAFVLRELDRVVLVGKQAPITVYELLDEAEARARWRPLIEAYAAALSAYRLGEFARAAAMFEEVAARFSDPVASAMAFRCRKLAAHPPKHWEGVWIATHK
ncbi:MAG: adenylate/guanylate cyclase domain-containing protein [Zetaproteobacteria bacterium]|nr:MAG: adenylate/guanylate cyclase domain-containing protein [Zetaproteobacteria bacterium]